MIDFITKHLFTVSLIVNGATIGIILGIINKVWNKDKFGNLCENAGLKFTKWGNGKWKFWEKIETFLEERLDIAVVRFKQGLNSDNGVDKSNEDNINILKE